MTAQGREGLRWGRGQGEARPRGGQGTFLGKEHTHHTVRGKWQRGCQGWRQRWELWTTLSAIASVRVPWVLHHIPNTLSQSAQGKSSYCSPM